MLGNRPKQFKDHFTVEVGRIFADPRTPNKSSLMKRSIMGLVAVYNMLPDQVRERAAMDNQPPQASLPLIPKLATC